MEVIITVALFCAVIYLIDHHFLSYWTRHNFPQYKPTFLIGNVGSLLSGERSAIEFLAVIYEKFKKQRFIGVYFSYRPVLMVNDPELIQHIFVKDFKSFHDRPMPDLGEFDHLNDHLFNLRSQKWRNLRTKMTPTFTSGKLKSMFPIMKDCGKVLTDYVEKNIDAGIESLDFKELMARFTTNMISSTIFGIENDCINEPNHIFREKGTKIFYGNVMRKIRNILMFFTPRLTELLKIRFVDKDVEDFIKSLVQQTIEYREKNNLQRNDFMQLLMQLKNQGFVSADKEEVDSRESNLADKEDAVRKLTLNEIASQAFVFFAAGFETSSSTSSFCLYELAKNHDVQQKVCEEIERVIEEEGEMSYNALNKMKYLECCIDETLRKYPLVPVFRECTEDFRIPGSDLVIEKGTTIFTANFGMHRDPEIFEEPLKFKPERFLNSSQGNGRGKGILYFPFGEGPRNCIGERLGKLQAKLGVALLLSKFKFELKDAATYNEELKMRTDSLTLNAEGEIDLKFMHR